MVMLPSLLIHNVPNNQHLSANHTIIYVSQSTLPGWKAAVHMCWDKNCNFSIILSMCVYKSDTLLFVRPLNYLSTLILLWEELCCMYSFINWWLKAFIRIHRLLLLEGLLVISCSCMQNLHHPLYIILEYFSLIL